MSRRALTQPADFYCYPVEQMPLQNMRKLLQTLAWGILHPGPNPRFLFVSKQQITRTKPLFQTFPFKFVESTYLNFACASQKLHLNRAA